MIYGIGADIVEIQRLGASIERFGDRFLRRVLALDEMGEYQASRHPERFLAKRFAAKEAVVKALGTGFRDGLTFNQIRVAHDRSGKPSIVYLGRAKERARIVGISETLITIADERAYAVAFAIAIKADH